MVLVSRLACRSGKFAPIVAALKPGEPQLSRIRAEMAALFEDIRYILRTGPA